MIRKSAILTSIINFFYPFQLNRQTDKTTYPLFEELKKNGFPAPEAEKMSKEYED